MYAFQVLMPGVLQLLMRRDILPARLLILFCFQHGLLSGVLAGNHQQGPEAFCPGPCLVQEAFCPHNETTCDCRTDIHAELLTPVPDNLCWLSKTPHTTSLP